MNKKFLVVLMVFALVLAGLSAENLGIKVGGELGWGIDIGKLKIEDDDENILYKALNNGFAINLTGEYDFNQNWGVKATFGMMFAGKTKVEAKVGDISEDAKSSKSAGLYIDAAVDAKYTYAINDKISVSGLAGLELVSGYVTKDLDGLVFALSNSGDDDDISKLKNTAFGINIAAEGAYNITSNISITGGVNFAWLFVNKAEFLDVLKRVSDKIGVYSLYIRPYVGATYSF